MHPLRKPLAAAAAALAIAACGQQPAPESEQPTPEQQPSGTAVRTPDELDPLFARAATEFNVPADLLKAISFQETRWQMVSGAEEFAGVAPAHGLLALRDPRLTEGARLAGVSVHAARTDALANLRAGAALLSAYADEQRIDRADLAAWAPVAARLSGITHEAAAAQYIHSGVYALLRQGAVAENAAGGVAVSLMPHEGLEAKFAPRQVRAMAAGPDYAASIWRPSPNYGARPTGSIGDPSYIIIHTCEGNYSSCWSWLTNSAAQASAHYVVNETGTEISQLVTEANRAWHASATYDCALNGNVDCWLNGNSVNHFSIGIEHGGFASQTTFPAGQLDASAKLACDISRDQAVPRDRFHIVAHGQIQPATRTDPGPNWPWTSYITKVNAFCTTVITVDSNNANNNTAQGYVEASANWVSSSNVAGYYGSGYFYASTAAVSDAATFWFYLPEAGTRTLDAWWTSGTDRSTTAPFVVWNAAGTKLATLSVNQQVNGGQWNALGTWSFPAGWNKVQLSRWTAAGSVVIADAVRVR